MKLYHGRKGPLIPYNLTVYLDIVRSFPTYETSKIHFIQIHLRLSTKRVVRHKGSFVYFLFRVTVRTLRCIVILKDSV